MIRRRVREHRVAVWISGGLILAAIVLVALTLRREPPVTFAPTVPEPRPVGDSLVGPVRVTVDASDPARWVYFDFSRGAAVGEPGPLEWDLAFRRFNVMVNGGPGFAGRGGAVGLEATTLGSVGTAPGSEYEVPASRRDSVNPALERWYDYGFTSHLLTPKARVYAIRTADGRYAVLRFLSYYCPGATPGCMTFEYMYQGNGTRALR